MKASILHSDECWCEVRYAIAIAIHDFGPVKRPFDRPILARHTIRQAIRMFSSYDAE